MRRNLKLIVLFAGIHMVVTTVCFVYAWSAGFARFDDPDLPETYLSIGASAATEVLTVPGRLVWTSWASKNLPNALEWILFVANSLVWGAAALFVGSRARRRIAIR